jgi:NAD(P)-dependent dehydrogenase (short-subunit alcohol dehydrogenase family)
MSVYFITGVSTGLGHALALQAASAGHTVFGTVRNRTRSAESVSVLENKGISIMELDVTHPSACTEAINDATKKFGSIDVLINNAGYSVIGALEALR